MSRFTRYTFDCGHVRDWSDGTTGLPTEYVALSGPCAGCKRELGRKRAELRALYGKAANVVRSRKYPGR